MLNVGYSLKLVGYSLMVAGIFAVFLLGVPLVVFLLGVPPWTLPLFAAGALCLIAGRKKKTRAR